MIKEIQGIFYDQFDLPVMSDGDGGDSLHKLGHLHVAFNVRERLRMPNVEYYKPGASDYMEAIRKLSVRPGILTRHTSPPWNEPMGSKWGVTRDQLVPNLVASGAVWVCR